MNRACKTVAYKAILEMTRRLGDGVPPTPLARFIGETIAPLDLAAFYAHYGTRGGQPYAPAILLLRFSGYATGVFSSRQLERATFESVPFRCLAGNLPPDPDPLAAFRQTFLPRLKDLCVQVLLVAQAAGLLQLGAISLEGTTSHADASKRHAVSSQHLLS